MYNTDTRYCLCFCSCSYTYSWQLHFQVSGKWSVASKKNLKFEIFLIINRLCQFYWRAPQLKSQVESRKILCFMLTTKTSTRCPGWHPWHCYEYDTVFILYARQNIASADMLIKNIVSADIFIKKQSYVSVNAHLHVYVFSCYFLRFTCVCIVRVVRVVCK